MGLFSFASKNKDEAASAEGEFYSRAEDESQTARGRQRKPRKSSKSNSPADPMLPEKKRARRRLIGAVALVLAMIIGLPMLLDSEPKPVNDDISVQIPSKDKPGALPAAVPSSTSASASSSTPAASASASVPASASLGQQEQIVNLPPASANANGKVSAPVSATPARMPSPTTSNATVTPTAAPVATAKPKGKDETKPEAKAEAKPENKPEAKPEPKIAEAKPKLEHDDARAEAILEGKVADAKPNADKKTGKFIVQVAALASQDKVDELQGKLNGAGIKSYVQKVATDSGERVMRVRLGPFASKEEAESARAKLGKIGLSGKLLPSS